MKSLSSILAVVTLLAVGAAPGLSADTARADLHRMILKLDNCHVSLDFTDKPLPGVLEYLSTVTGVNLAVSPKLSAVRDPASLKVTLKLTDVSARTALDVVLQLENLSLVYQSGVLFVTTPKDARGEPVLRIYSIEDLTMPIRDFPAPEIGLHPSGSQDMGYTGQKEVTGREHAFADSDSIMDIITQNAGEGTWKDSGVKYWVNDRYLVIRQYRSVQRQIAEVLALLRSCQ